jgi:hypothetical protein
MKKMLSLFIVVVLFGTSILNAQVLTSKKGTPILPAAGDYVIGIGATPLLDFAGNLIKINSGNSYSSDAAWNSIRNDNTVYLKYFLDDKTAVRARLRINKTSRKETSFVTKNQSPNIDPFQYVEDSWVHNTTNILISGGLEKRRGYGRLQGFYGAEVSLAITGAATDKYTYGNDLDATYTNPNRTNFNGNVIWGFPTTYATEVKTKAAFGFGVGVFAGVEYFVLPKISIGGEFGWSIGMNLSQSNGERTQDMEYWGTPPGSTSTTNGVQKVTTKGGKTSYFNIDNSQTGGNLFLLFHF